MRYGHVPDPNVDGSLSRRGVRAGGGTSSTSPNYDFHWHGRAILDESSHSCQQPCAARPLGAAGWSSCSVACGAGAGGSAPTAAPDAALMPPPCSRSFSVRSFSSPSSSPAPSSLSSSIIGVGVRRPLRPGASTDLTVTLAWHALCVHVAASRLLWRSSP